MIGPSMLMLLGCAPALEIAPEIAPTPAPENTSDCGCYDDPEIRGYCLSQVAGQTPPAPGSVSTFCDGAGPVEVHCRKSWVMARTHPQGEPTDALLAACRDADCAFFVLDARPLADPLMQIPRCIEHAGPFIGDCAGHAMERWSRDRGSALTADSASAACGDHAGCVIFVLNWIQDPDLVIHLGLCADRAGEHAEDCARYALRRWHEHAPAAAARAATANAGRFPRIVGQHLGVQSACRGGFPCEGPEAVVTACEESILQAQSQSAVCAGF